MEPGNTRGSAKHDRKAFSKYMPTYAALAVLANNSLRWSSPLSFNDPFDVPRELSFGVTPQHMAEALGKRVRTMIDNPPKAAQELNVSIQRLIRAAKSLPEEQKRALIERICQRGGRSPTAERNMEALRAMWRQQVSELRILCLSEDPKHVAMWYHYADKYQGVVLEFRCSELTDSAWLAARKVGYSAEPSSIYTADGWAELITLENGAAVERMVDWATLNKSADWSYEREWRVVTFRRSNETEGYSDYAFRPSELSAVYLGPLIKRAEALAIFGLLDRYPNCKVWQVTIGMGRELLFTPSDRASL